MCKRYCIDVPLSPPSPRLQRYAQLSHCCSETQCHSQEYPSHSTFHPHPQTVWSYRKRYHQSPNLQTLDSSIICLSKGQRPNECSGFQNDIIAPFLRGSPWLLLSSAIVFPSSETSSAPLQIDAEWVTWPVIWNCIMAWQLVWIVLIEGQQTS